MTAKAENSGLPRRCRNRLVQGVVAVLELLQAFRHTRLIDCGLHLLDIGAARARNRKFGNRRLQRQPKLHQVTRTGLPNKIQLQMRGERQACARQGPHRRLGADKRAASDLSDDDALLFEAVQRLPDRVACGHKARRNLALRRKLVAGLQGLPRNTGLDEVSYFPRRFPGAVTHIAVGQRLAYRFSFGRKRTNWSFVMKRLDNNADQ